LGLIDQQSLVKVNFYYNISFIEYLFTFFPLSNLHYLWMIYSALCQLWSIPLQLHLTCLKILYVRLLQLILVQITSMPMEIFEVANLCAVWSFLWGCNAQDLVVCGYMWLVFQLWISMVNEYYMFFCICLQLSILGSY